MDSGDRTDATYIARAKEGDLKAFDQLVVRHRQRALNLARRILGDGDAAQDVTQEAFLQVYRSLQTFRDPFPFPRFSAWLNTIVHRQALRRLQQRERNIETIDDAFVRSVPGGLSQFEPEPPDELVERVRTALQVLSVRERSVMILHYLEGRSCEEIARRLQLSAGNVKRILYDSRQKVRKESAKMVNEAKKGPRKLVAWVDGNPGEGNGNVFFHLNTALPQTVCLAVNKTAKTTAQIADQAATHPAYVEEIVADLLQMQVLEVPSKGKYLANFIAFDAADWRRLMSSVREPAARVAIQLTHSHTKMKYSYEQTPLCRSGIAWEEVIWPVYATLITNLGASRNEAEIYRPLRPERLGGGRYWLGGHEDTPNLAPVWTTAFSEYRGGFALPHGYFWTFGLERESWHFHGEQEISKIVEILADAPHSESELLQALDGDIDHCRGRLAKLVKHGLVKAENHKMRLRIPVFTQPDSDILTPVVDEIIGPIVRDIAEPAFTDIDKLLDEMGYAHKRAQYAQWHRWLIGYVMGEALRFLMEQGFLPRPSEPAPANFAFIAWKGDLPLMSWEVK
jgi:RNA polymerase sigma-70 factor (ECF subfamily)